MNTVKFKKSLFGFKRRQVIDYIAEAEALFFNENSRLQGEIKTQNTQIEQLSDEVMTATNNLAAAAAINEESQKQIAELTERSESFKALSVETINKCQALEGQLIKKNTAYDVLVAENTSLREQITKLSSSETKLKAELEKTLEKAALNDRTHAKSRALLVEYLDFIHKKNIELTEENSSLEAKLSKTGEGSLHASYPGSFNTDDLLKTIREDIGNALDLIAGPAGEKPGQDTDGNESSVNLKVL